MGLDEKAVRRDVRALVKEHGATRAARMLGMGREMVLAIGCEARVHPASLIAAAQKLQALDATETA